MNENSNKEDNKNGYLKYLLINFCAIFLLLLITEIIQDATILHNYTILAVTVAIALIPIFAQFISHNNVKRLFYIASTVATMLLLILLYFLRTKVSKYTVGQTYIDSDSILKKILDSTEPNGVVIVIDYFGISDDIDDELKNSFEQLSVDGNVYKKLGLKGEFANIEDVLKVKRWSGGTKRGIYTFFNTIPPTIDVSKYGYVNIKPKNK